MAFGDIEVHGDDAVLSEINMIPLIDVMLVLLIVFIITVPVINHAVRLDLPRASAQRAPDRPQAVRVSVDGQGAYHWNDTAVSDESLAARLAQVAVLDSQPELHIRGDRSVRYERVALLMAQAKVAGMRKIAFVTDPRMAAPGAPGTRP
jgi:biopolymer transport protein ExbD